MKRLLMLFLIPALLVAPDIPIYRNQSWNKSVLALQVLLDNLEPIQEFLKKHETEVTLDQIDVRVLKNLDKAVEASDELEKNLKKLKKNIKEKP